MRPGHPLPLPILRLVDEPNVAHLATLRAHGAPKVDPMWLGREGELLLVATGGATGKARNVARDPRVGLSIVDRFDPYEGAQLGGRVVEIRPDEDLAVIDALALAYTGARFPWRAGEGRVTILIEVTSARHVVLPFTTGPGA